MEDIRGRQFFDEVIAAGYGHIKPVVQKRSIKRSTFNIIDMSVNPTLDLLFNKFKPIMTDFSPSISYGCAQNSYSSVCTGDSGGKYQIDILTSIVML